MLRAADQSPVQVVRWTHDGATLEGLLVLPPAAGPHPLLVFLHGGPVSGLACGEHPDPSPWISQGWAVLMPEFRSSGIAGSGDMRQAFRDRGLPGPDPEVGDVLAGVDLLTSRGVADSGALILLGHSYGGYLAARIIARDHRFRAAVCCEAVADLRLLDPVSQRMQAGWLGGDAHQVPRRWEAASPVTCTRHVRTPLLLVYAEAGALAAQGHAWQRALAADWDPVPGSALADYGSMICPPFTGQCDPADGSLGTARGGLGARLDTHGTRGACRVRSSRARKFRTREPDGRDIR
jgi:dienelactone hydrolase